MQGQGKAVLAQMHQGLAAILATGQMLARPRCLVLLAEAVGHTGQVAEGLRLLAEALAALEASALRRVRSSPLSMAGSPRALILLISKRPRLCLQHAPALGAEHGAWRHRTACPGVCS